MTTTTHSTTAEWTTTPERTPMSPMRRTALIAGVAYMSARNPARSNEAIAAAY